MKAFLEKICNGVDMVAGILLGICTIVIVVSTAGRYLFSWAVPDAFDLSRLLIGGCVMWGFASVAYKGGHIAVDLVWELLSRRGRVIIDIFAWSMSMFFTVLLAIMTYRRVMSAYASNESTFDLRLPVWPFLALIWLGVAASVLMMLFAFKRVRTGEDDPHSPEETAI